jgi:heterodisulfide reductase subunit C2
VTAAIDTAAVERLAGTPLRDCYQCGKCSAGCPMAGRMDMLPNQIVQLVKQGRADRAMQSEAVWTCVSCLTCTARCPQSVDCAAVMDALRQLSVELGSASPACRRTVIFQRAFLENIRRNGRLRELDLVGAFKTRALLADGSISRFLKDALLAPRMLVRGKLRFAGGGVRDRGVVRRIFDRCMAADSGAMEH